MSSRTELATLAGGCFWCLEAVFAEVEGVEEVRSGYTGGATADPTYRQVCTGKTGHAEAVEIRFRPDIISYRDLLQIFFTVHDPTTLDRQGADAGPQYRSAIFYHSERQKELAGELVAELEGEGVWQGIVTALEPAGTFYPAEAEHRNYYRRSGEQPYCRAVIAPKLRKLRQTFPDKLSNRRLPNSEPLRE